jgi:hypothetical protein
MQDTDSIVPHDAPTDAPIETGSIEAAPAAGETIVPSSAEPTPPPAESSPSSDSAEQEGAIDPSSSGVPSSAGQWECLNEPRNCELAAPDPRTAAKLFDGPTQDEARALQISVACPGCKGEKVLYRGAKTEAKTDAAVAA